MLAVSVLVCGILVDDVLCMLVFWIRFFASLRARPGIVVEEITYDCPLSQSSESLADVRILHIYHVEADQHSLHNTASA